MQFKDNYRIHRTEFFPLQCGGGRRSLCCGALVGSPRDTPRSWAHVGWMLSSSPFSVRVVTATRWEWWGENRGRCDDQPCASDAKSKASRRERSASFIFRSAHGGVVEPSLHCHGAGQTGQQFSVPFLLLQRKGHWWSVHLLTFPVSIGKTCCSQPEPSSPAIISRDMGFTAGMPAWCPLHWEGERGRTFKQTGVTEIRKHMWPFLCYLQPSPRSLGSSKPQSHLHHAWGDLGPSWAHGTSMSKQALGQPLGRPGICILHLVEMVRRPGCITANFPLPLELRTASTWCSECWPQWFVRGHPQPRRRPAGLFSLWLRRGLSIHSPPTAPLDSFSVHFQPSLCDWWQLPCDLGVSSPCSPTCQRTRRFPLSTWRQLKSNTRELSALI